MTRSSRALDDPVLSPGTASLLAADPTRGSWRLVAALVALGGGPVLAGVFRLHELTGPAGITPDNARFFAHGGPLTAHIVSVSVFTLLGAVQFAPELLRGAWHRWTGRLLVPFGVVGALTGVWLTLVMPPGDDGGPLLFALRMLSGPAMAGCLVLGVIAIRRGQLARHRAWMIRGYALGLAAGTQFLVHLPWFALVGEVTPLSHALLMGLGWAINLAVAEWTIRGPGPDPVP